MLSSVSPSQINLLLTYLAHLVESGQAQVGHLSKFDDQDGLLRLLQENHFIRLPYWMPLRGLWAAQVYRVKYLQTLS